MNVQRFLYICDPKGVVTRKQETGARGEIKSVYISWSMGAWVRLSVHVIDRPAQLSKGEHDGKAWLLFEAVIVERLIFWIFLSWCVAIRWR